MTAVVRKFVKNPEIVKDLTQEIFIRAYLNYDYYTEEGKIRAWLSVISHNKLKNYYKTEKYRNDRMTFSSLDCDTGENFMFSYNSYNTEDLPENIVVRRDDVDRIIKIINTLPQKQRDVIMYSYVYNYSEAEIASMKNISVGSVKSAKHYGLEKVKKLISPETSETNKFNNSKGTNNMSKLNRQEAYSLLYQYAKGHIPQEDKTAVEEYMKTDEESANIASALKQLYPKLTYARDDEMMHISIAVVLDNGDHILYSAISYYIEDYERRNRYLEEHDGYTPENEKWFDSGFNGNRNSITQFDNEGNKLETEMYIPNGNDEKSDYRRIYIKRMKKVYYPVHWKYTVYYTEKKDLTWTGAKIKKSEKAPNLFEARTENWLGANAKSALYLALPENATNIRMIRGNGVIDCGKYKFLYADRYVTSDEGIFAECTFNM